MERKQGADAKIDFFSVMFFSVFLMPTEREWESEKHAELLT